MLYSLLPFGKLNRRNYTFRASPNFSNAFKKSTSTDGVASWQSSILSLLLLHGPCLANLQERCSVGIGKNNNTRTVQAESSKFASVSFDQGFQIWVGWNWSECHLTVFCINPIVPGFVVYYVNSFTTANWWTWCSDIDVSIVEKKSNRICQSMYSN